jgi:hypothetical protein
MVRICVYLTAEMACEKARLHLKQAPHRHAIAINRVGYLLIEAPLIGRIKARRAFGLRFTEGPAETNPSPLTSPLLMTWIAVESEGLLETAPTCQEPAPGAQSVRDKSLRES